MSKNDKDDLVVAYLELRWIVGLLGMMMPVILYFGGKYLFNTGMQTSLSSYYYTDMGDEFVGILFALGVFLFTYRGYNKKNKGDRDNLIANFASICAIGIALFPTTMKGSDPTWVGKAHVWFTAGFFVALIYFAVALFTKSDLEKKDRPKKKNNQNIVYYVCGILMGISLVGILFYSNIPWLMNFLGVNGVFWLESGAIFSFGVAWFVKGKAIERMVDWYKKK